MTSKAVAASFVSSTMSKNSNTAQPSSPSSEEPWDTNYGSTDAQEQRLTSPYQLHGGSSPPPDGIFRRATAPDAAEASDIDDDSLDEEYEMSLTELLYSSASYHAIVKPGEESLKRQYLYFCDLRVSLVYTHHASFLF
jgi:hypothetical protein